MTYRFFKLDFTLQSLFQVLFVDRLKYEKIPVYLVTWPYADDDLRADSINVIEENNDVTKVNSIHLIRLIARQLSDEFLSVFVLDINGLVSLFLSTAEIMNFLDMWKI